MAAYAELYPHAPEPVPSSLRSRTVRTCYEVGRALSDTKWGDTKWCEPVGRVDCLFALERLAAPYRNIRGHDIGVHTEPIDALWPMATPPPGSAAAKAMAAFASEHELPGNSRIELEALRELAGVASDALSLGIGDGGNEVGMGKVAACDEVGALSPGGEFVPIAVNGAYRSCDHLIAGTVSNWAGTAFEAAAHLLHPPAVEYAAPREVLGVEKAILTAIMAPPAGSVDGKYPGKPSSVDGLAWEPYHQELYQQLWQLAGVAV